MIWILVIAAIIGIAYYVNKNKGSSSTTQSSSYRTSAGSQATTNTMSSSNHSSTGSVTSGENALPLVPTDAIEAVKCLAQLFEEIDSKLSYLHMPSEIHLDFSQPKDSNVACLFIWYSKDYDGLGEWARKNYSLSNGFSVSNNTIEYRSQSITGFRKNMNAILDVFSAYYPNARLDYDNNPMGYSDYMKEYFVHGVYRV